MRTPTFSQINHVEQSPKWRPACYWYEHGSAIADPIMAGDTVHFMTKGGTRVDDGTVLEIDLGGAYPIRVEWYTPAGDKRIERFHVDEFTEFWKD